MIVCCAAPHNRLLELTLRNPPYEPSAPFPNWKELESTTKERGRTWVSVLTQVLEVVDFLAPLQVFQRRMWVDPPPPSVFGMTWSMTALSKQLLKSMVLMLSVFTHTLDLAVIPKSGRRWHRKLFRSAKSFQE